MTIDQLRAALGLGADVSDAEVQARYASLVASWSQAEASAAEPAISMESARRQLQFDEDDTSQDEHLSELLADAIGWVERRTGLLLTVDSPRNMRRAALVLLTAYHDDREGGDVLAKAEASAGRLCDSCRVMAI